MLTAGVERDDATEKAEGSAMTEFEDPRTGKQYRIESLPGGLVQFVADGVALFTAKREDVEGEFYDDECGMCEEWESWYGRAPNGD